MRHPLLYQFNTRVYLTQLGGLLGRPATLDDVPDAELDGLAELGFEWVWLLSVWQTGLAGQRISRSSQALRAEFREVLPDLREEDIAGSGFAITGYKVNPSLGGNEALRRLRSRLNGRGLRLMLDFIPNHTALDHPWVNEHPDYYVSGSPAHLEREPHNYVRLVCRGKERILAHGRDPCFTGWTDTLQLDYSHPRVRNAMTRELCAAAALCDGARCDMAMLILPDVFERTWGHRAEPFWPDAIQRVRKSNPGFVFLAEVYWDLEAALQEQGFDYTYGKGLYDCLRDRDATSVRRHLEQPPEYLNRLAHFLENHDEARAASVFPVEVHQPAGAITYLSPGMRFFHQGQLDGHRKRISAHLVRAPVELIDPALERFYRDLLELLRLRQLRLGQWTLLRCMPVFTDSLACENVLAFAWATAEDPLIIVVVNYGSNEAERVVTLDALGVAGHAVRATHLFGTCKGELDGVQIQGRGLTLRLPPWGYEVFTLT